MAISKVNFGDQTLIDLTSDTVTESTLLLGATAHNSAGESIIGSYTPPSGYTEYATGTFTGSATVISTSNLTFRPKLVIAMYDGKVSVSSYSHYYPMVVAIFDDNGNLLKSMFGGASAYSKVSSLVGVVKGTASAGGFSLTLPSGNQYAVNTRSSNRLFHAYG